MNNKHGLCISLPTFFLQVTTSTKPKNKSSVDTRHIRYAHASTSTDARASAIINRSNKTTCTARRGHELAIEDFRRRSELVRRHRHLPNVPSSLSTVDAHGDEYHRDQDRPHDCSCNNASGYDRAAGIRFHHCFVKGRENVGCPAGLV